MTFRYPLCRPYITADMRERVAAAIASGWVGAEGPELEEFAARWAELHERRYCVLTSSGTAALRLALDACGVPEDGLVVMPSFTFQATAAALNGRSPLFVDVGPNGVVEQEEMDRACKVLFARAAVPVALYGVEPYIPKGITTIVDAAQAHGVVMGGDVLCHSFAANKVITTGMGGALLTDDEDIYDNAKTLAGHAGMLHDRYTPVAAGHNCRMSNVQAALGCAQLDGWDYLRGIRRLIMEAYGRRLMLWPPADCVESPWLVTIRVPAAHRDAIQAHLAKRGVETRKTFPGLHMGPLYSRYVIERTVPRYPMTDLLASEGLSLPTWPELNAEDVEVICGLAREALQEAG